MLPLLDRAEQRDEFGPTQGLVLSYAGYEPHVNQLSCAISWNPPPKPHRQTTLHIQHMSKAHGYKAHLGRFEGGRGVLIGLNPPQKPCGGDPFFPSGGRWLRFDQEKQTMQGIIIGGDRLDFEGIPEVQ
jgi:hypothetical protein